MKRSRAGISVMFMTFIAVSILSTIFLTYYLYLTQQNLSASEAQRIYAEAAQERLEAFFYPPAKEASDLGISQRLRINNRGIGTIIRYIFAPMVQEEPLNSEDIILRSGANITLQLDQTIPDEENIRIVTDRGSVFIAQLGYFNISFDPARLVLYPGQQGVSVLRIASKNYESLVRVTVTSSNVDYEVIGNTEFYMRRNGIYSVTINVTAPEAVGSYQLAAIVENPETGYSKEATLEVEVTEAAAISIPFPYFKIQIPEDQKHINVTKPKHGQKEVSISFSVVGYNDYYGDIKLKVYYPDEVLKHPEFKPRDRVSLTPDNPQEEVTLTFKIDKHTPTGNFTIWIIGEDSLQNNDYFELTITT